MVNLTVDFFIQTLYNEDNLSAGRGRIGMTRMFSTKSMMMFRASADFAEACSTCAHNAHENKNMITLLLDAIIMASIIITLISLNSVVLVLRVVLLVVVLLVVLLIMKKLNMRRGQPSS